MLFARQAYRRLPAATSVPLGPGATRYTRIGDGLAWLRLLAFAGTWGTLLRARSLERRD